MEFLIAGLLGVIVLTAIIQKPFFGLYLFTVMLYIKPAIFGAIFASMRVTLLVGALTFFALFFHSRKNGGLRFFDDVQSKWLVAFGVVMCLSLATSIWKSNTVGFIGNFLKIYIAYFLITNLLDALKRFRAIVWAMVLSMLYIGVTSIKSYYGSGGGDGRMFGAYSGALFGDPNDMALGFTMLIPFLYFDLFRGRGILRKIIQLGIMGVFFWSIVLTQSRGGTIGLMVMFFVLWLKNKRKVLVAVLGILILSAGWQIAPQSYRDRILSIQTAADDDNAAISRMDAWKAGVNMMKSRVFGVGGGNFGEGFVLYRPSDAVDVQGVRRASHNMFIQVGGETGLPGLIIFLFMLGETFKGLNRTKRGMTEDGGWKIERNKEIVLLADATFVSLVGYCASGFFLSQGYNFVLYYLVAFSVVLEHISNQENEIGKIEKGKKKEA
ncbi:MAG TPA: O-antigen ligase family protein [Candidatus Omnitrophota bacterium]|nr:O-antigen ligase family protein [Candidatus Omnitrophota bacterium]